MASVQGVSANVDELTSPQNSEIGFFKTDPKNILFSTRSDLVPSTPRASNASQRVIVVYCGSSLGNSPAYMEAAHALAHAMHKNKIKLVYGGGTIGLMGVIAKTLVSLSGPDAVHGIFPAPLFQFERHSQLQKDVTISTADVSVFGHTTVVRDVHTRKQLMGSEVFSGAPGSGFIALPGGYGTFDEVMEAASWNSLGFHDRCVVVFNIEGYWNSLLSWVKDAVSAGFVAEHSKNIISEAKTAEECIELMARHSAREGNIKLNWCGE